MAEFVNLCVGQLKKNTAFPPSLHDSLCGRLEYLKRESVRQAIHRILQESFPGETTALKVIDRAYRVRSDIVHEGRPKDPVLYLEKLTLEVGEVLRKIYAARLGRELIFPLSSS